MNNYVWEILVPTAMPLLENGVVVNYNNTKPVRLAHHKQWDRFVEKITGGLTIMPVSKGIWIDSNRLRYYERMIPVRIMCSENDIIKIAQFTIKHYRQKAVMYYRISTKVRILYCS